MNAVFLMTAFVLTLLLLFFLLSSESKSCAYYAYNRKGSACTYY